MTVQLTLVLPSTHDRTRLPQHVRLPVRRAPDATRGPATGDNSIERTLQMLVRTVSVSDVRSLLDATGPLSLHEIAAGLGVSDRQAAAVVGWMLEHDCVQQDEHERYRPGSVVVGRGYRPV